ncbi:MAG: tetratricopeptide repeat protein [Thermaurantimonas sp.]|uniref:tetratricopeptide repeat protein n=1 Tax=Thermaurantimonas sp. TaxID=2681568 RepID=UPI00391D662C
MKKLGIWPLALLTLLTWSCSSGTETSEEKNEAKELIAEIEAIESKLLKTLPEADTTLAVKLIDKMQSYSQAYPQDTLSAQFLIKAANLYLLLPDREIDALRQLQLVYTRFAGQPYAAQALFLSGMIYDNNLRQPQQAIRMWEQVVADYPSHPLAAQASNLLKITDTDPYNDLEMIERWLNDPKNKSIQSAENK